MAFTDNSNEAEVKFTFALNKNLFKVLVFKYSTLV